MHKKVYTHTQKKYCNKRERVCFQRAIKCNAHRVEKSRAYIHSLFALVRVREENGFFSLIQFETAHSRLQRHSYI